MTSVYDIPYEDIKQFLDANGKSFNNEDDAYNKALILLKNKKAIGHTISIIEWMMAHNLLIRKVDISNYTSSQIDNMNQNQINNLAKLLTMSGNDIDNIKNILRYLGKLDNKILLPEIDASIFGLLNDLEINEINFDTIKFNDVINLLKNHRNKALIRKSIYDNLEKIIFYNLLDINVERLDNLEYIKHLIYNIPKDLVFELLKINQKILLRNHTMEEIENTKDFMKQARHNIRGVDLYQDIGKFANFLINLTKINEIGLAKKVFDIANKYNFRGTIGNIAYSFNERLTLMLVVDQNYDVFNKLFNLIGEEEFMKLNRNIINDFNTTYIKKFLNILVRLENYELFMKILNLLIAKDYKGSRGVINMMLPRLERAIESNNKELLIRYLDIVNKALHDTIRLGGNRTALIEKMIKAAEQDES